MTISSISVPGRVAVFAAAVLVSLSSAFGRSRGDAPQQNAALNDSVNRAVATVMASSIDEVLTGLVRNDVPLDRAEVGRYVAEYLSNKNLGFDKASATHYIDSLVYAAAPTIPDTVSLQSQQQFVEQAAAQPGAILMPSGLVFTVISEGEGVSPTVKDRVNVNYVAKLSDGTVFDDTEGNAITFDVAGVIPGFTEGLRQMKPGGTYRLVIPASLGYGEHGIPGIIPGNAALDFTVTLEAVMPVQNQP